VLLTRSDDKALSHPYRVRDELNARAALVNRAGSWLVLSIHLNTEPTGRAVGPIVYYRAGSPAGLRLAQALEAELSRASHIAHRPRPSHLLLLMASRAPAVVVELGFLSNPADRARLQSRSYQAALAAAMATGILAYLGR